MPEPRHRHRPGFIRLLTLALAAAGGSLSLALFGQSDGSAVPVARGVVTRHYGSQLSGVRVLDADLSQPGVRVRVAADDIALRMGRVTGKSRRVADWLSSTGAVGGVNGGFFGAMVDGDHKEIVGLLKLNGRVRVAAPPKRSTSTGRTYARSTLGFRADGSPRIGWVNTASGKNWPLREHAAPEFDGQGTPWTVHEALQCGPRLIHNGKIAVAQRGERLASPGALPRTFVGYGGPGGAARYFVLCAADGMEFDDCARFLRDYFRREHGCACQEAMCMDGGGSTQASWRENGSIHSDPDPHTTVPTALLIFAGK